MLTLSRGAEDGDRSLIPEVLAPAARIVVIAVVGVATGLLGMNLIDSNIAHGTFTEADVRAMQEPSPLYAKVITALDEADALNEQTAAAR